MRKEVRLGAAIGGVLIAVVVVYAIVVSRSQSKKKDNIVLDTKTSPAGDTSGGTDHSTPADPAVPATPDHPAAPAAGSNLIADATPPGPATGGVAGTALPAHPDDSSPLAPDAPAVKPANNWAALLSADHVQDFAPLRTHTPEPDGQTADAGTAGNVLSTIEPRVTRTLPEHPVTGGLTTIAPSDTPSTGAKSHTVKSGETFSSISRDVYGDSRFFKEILRANPNVDPTHLKPGVVITLPDRAQFKHDAKAAGSTASSDARHHSSSPATDGRTEYRVQSSDNLYKISMKLYHTANKVDSIYQLNKEAIGADPAKLKLNMVLKLPEPPTVTASR